MNLSSCMLTPNLQCYHRDDIAAIANVMASHLRDNSGLCYALVGDLGAGKTLLSRYILQALGVDNFAGSPTFNIYQQYKVKKHTIIHADFYRIKQEQEFIGIDWDGVLAQANTSFLIEWGQLFLNMLPKYTVWVKLTDIGNLQRQIEFAI